MCVDHVWAGEFTIHFSPGDRGLHLPSLAKKVNPPPMPEEGEAGVSNDWCIMPHEIRSNANLVFISAPLIKWSVNFRAVNLHYICPKFLINPTHFRQLGNTSFLFCALLSHSL